MNRDLLTEKQRHALEFVERHIAQHDQSPTFQEVADFFGVTVHAADARLRECKRKGFIDWTANKKRSMKVVA